MKAFPAHQLLAAFALVLLACRISGPSDMDTKDQPRTVSYTVDIVESGSWSWPHDMMGHAAYKPPLYNWIGAAVLLLTGIYSPFTFKLPALIMGLACLLPIWLSVRHLSARSGADPMRCRAVFAFAGFAWLANFTVYGLIYTARPDMAFCFFLFSAWTLSTLLLDDSALLAGKRGICVAALWLVVIAAILSKGTPVLLALIYMPIYSLLRHRSLRPLLRIHFPTGLLLTAGLVLAWHHLIWVRLPLEDRNFLVNVESKRISENGWFETLSGIYKMPHYFLVRYLPWSLVFLGLMLIKEKVRISRSPYASVFIWFLVVLVFFSVPVFKRDDYLLPVYPVCSIAVGFAMANLRKTLQVLVSGLACCLMIGAVMNDFLFKDHLVPRFDDNTQKFARQIRLLVPHKRPIVFFETGYNNLKAFLGTNHPPAQIPLRSLPADSYFVQPVHLLTIEQAKAYRVSGPVLDSYEPVRADLPPAAELLALSQPLPHVHGNRPGLLGLYLVRRPAPKT